jgi:hypothetical protein
MSDLICPNGHSVPDPNPSRDETGMGAAIGDVPAVAPHRVTCPGCGTKLIRNPESPFDELSQWRVDDGPSGVE